MTPPNAVSSFVPRGDVAHRVVRNPRLRGLRCLRCKRPVRLDAPIAACEHCAAQGVWTAYRADYDDAGAAGGIDLPYNHGVSLGEGSTPCCAAPALAVQAGVAELWIKDESRNPTGSHKDRMSAIAVSRALECGAHTVVLASSGNAAVSLAQYARAAGLRCEVAVYTYMDAAYRARLAAQGAICVAFDDNAGRWAYVRARANQAGVLAITNFHLPALGSLPVAIEGYKSIAAECVTARVSPTDVVVPTARGDLAWGIWAGFAELAARGHTERVPRIWVVEPFARLSRVFGGASLHGVHPGRTAQFSTGGETATYLQWQAATESGGGAIVVDDMSAWRAREVLDARGIDAELCAAAAFGAIATLRERGELQPDARVAWILTAGSAHDPTRGTPAPPASPDARDQGVLR